MVKQTPLMVTENGMLKLENFQHTGAYKVRGASNAVLSMLERGPKQPVIAASAGNHAAGLAWAARQHGVQATAVVPFGTPKVKIRKCQSLGCRVVIFGSSVAESLKEAKRIALKEGMYFVHPFEDTDVICGQGTMGLELLEENPDVILVPIGGGGLASGIGLACSNSLTRVIGVQLDGLDVMRRRLFNLSPMSSMPVTIADGVMVSNPGQLTEQLCRNYLDDVITVSEDEVIETVIQLADQHNIIVEGAGALAVAALPKIRATNKIAVVTGGNIDLNVFSELILSRTMQKVA